MDEIGPIKLSKAGTGVESVLDAKAVMGEAPYFKIKSKIAFLGVEEDAEVIFSKDKIKVAFSESFGAFGEGRVSAQTKGMDLSSLESLHIDDFVVEGLFKQDIVKTGLIYIKQGLKEVVDNDTVVNKTVKQIQEGADFLNIKEVSFHGAAGAFTNKSKTIDAHVKAMIVGKHHSFDMVLHPADQTEALAQIMKKLGNQIGEEAKKVVSIGFDKDIIRKYSDAFYFYEGNNCTQEVVGTNTYPVAKRSKTIKAKETKWLQDDEARSLKIRKLIKGAEIRVYDSPDGKTRTTAGITTDDDYSIITILENSEADICINSFENNFTSKSGKWKIYHHHVNGLDGKVSRVTIVNP